MLIRFGQGRKPVGDVDAIARGFKWPFASRAETGCPWESDRTSPAEGV